MSKTLRTEADVARLALACLDLTSLNDGDREADVDRAVPARRGRARHAGRACACGRSSRTWPCSTRRAACAWRRSPTFPTAAPTCNARWPTPNASCRRVRTRSTWCCPIARCWPVMTRLLQRAAARGAPRLRGADAEGDPRDRRVARASLDAARRAPRAGRGRRLPQDQQRQDAGQRHAGGGALPAAARSPPMPVRAAASASRPRAASARWPMRRATSSWSTQALGAATLSPPRAFASAPARC